MLEGSLVALVTPMLDSGHVDDPCLRRLVEWHVEAGTAGLVVAGTTGESATLTKAEHLAVIGAVAKYADGRVPVIAGTGSNSTQQTVDLSVAAGQFSIDGYLIVTPYYNKPTQEGLYRHFCTIADAVHRPVMLYNVPGRTAVDLLPETVSRLAEHPQINAIKEATGDLDRVEILRQACGDDFGLYSGDDLTGREFMLRGGNGVVSVTANVAPQLMAGLCRAALAGDADEAAAIDGRLSALHRSLFVEANPIPVKWALERLGRIPAGIRLPLTPLATEYHGEVTAALEQAGLL